MARYCAAADLFVLPSMLEALPTVAVEALACGTPVISADNPGGLELNDVFGRDVSIVAREQPLPLAQAIVAFLLEKRRTNQETRDAIEREFRPGGVAAKYRALYRRRDDEGRRMMRSLGRALAAALLAAFGRRNRAGARVRLVGRAPTSTSTSRRRAAIIDGVYPSERDPNTGRTFAWTGETLTIDLDDIDRQVDWLLQSPRSRRACRRGTQPGSPLLRRRRPRAHPPVARRLRGCAGRRSRRGPRSRAWRSRCASSSTFVPGPSDPRALGVMLDSLTLTPSADRPSAAVRRSTGVALASAALGAAVGAARRDSGVGGRHRDPAERRARGAGGARFRTIHRLRRRRGADDDLDRCRDRAPCRAACDGCAASRSGTRRSSRLPLRPRRSSSSCSCSCTRTCRLATRCSTRTAFRTCSAGATTSRRSLRGTTSSRTHPGSTSSRFRSPASCVAAWPI